MNILPCLLLKNLASLSKCKYDLSSFDLSAAVTGSTREMGLVPARSELLKRDGAHDQ